MNAFELFLKQKRFDLIFKYLYVVNNCEYNRLCYIESIRAFNSFYEEDEEYDKPKEGVGEFLKSFSELIKRIDCNGYNDSSQIPIGHNGDIVNGAHRLSICAAKQLDIKVTNVQEEHLFDYNFFKKRGMDEDIMDYGALEYVKLNSNAHIVNLFSAANPANDQKVIEILNKYGFVFYQKNVNLNFNGYVNLKKISYGSFWEHDTKWIGNRDNYFSGAQAHAQKSLGRGENPTRIFVFVCDSLNDVVKAKAEIRALYNIGNYSVHINDCHDEAIWLAETYFNKNSIDFLNKKLFWKDDCVFDENIEHFKHIILNNSLPLDSCCCVGSTTLNAYQIRRSDDLDYISINDSFYIEDKIISPHDDQLKYYSISKDEIITNPNNHFYYHGVKILVPNETLNMKRNRREFPKDHRDCFFILLFFLILKLGLNSKIFYKIIDHKKICDFLFKSIYYTSRFTKRLIGKIRQILGGAKSKVANNYFARKRRYKAMLAEGCALMIEMPFFDKNTEISIKNLYRYYWFSEAIQYFNFKLELTNGMFWGKKEYVVKGSGYSVQKLDFDFDNYIKTQIKSPERALIRKAIKNSFTCKLINYDDYLPEIEEINTSKTSRQGRVMEEDYIVVRKREDVIKQYNQNLYTFGCFSKEGKLVAYYIFEVITNVIHVAFGIGHSEFLNMGIMNYLYAFGVTELSNKHRGKFIIYGPTPSGKLWGLFRFKKNVGCKTLPIIYQGTKTDFKLLERFTKKYKLHGDSPLNFIQENA